MTLLVKKFPSLTFALPDEVERFPDLCESSVPHQTNTQVHGVLNGRERGNGWSQTIQFLRVE